MRCPRCRDASLDALTTGGGVSVRFCSRCRGMWCDRGHLAPLIGVGPDHPRLLWARRGVALPGDYSCPACGEGSLRSLHVGSSDEIRLEECSSCGGTWINGGLLPELRTQLSVLPQGRSTAPPPRPTSAPPGARPPTVPPAPRLPSIANFGAGTGARPPTVPPAPRLPSISPSPRPPSVAPTPRPPSVAPTPRPPSVAPPPAEPVRAASFLANDTPITHAFAVPVALSFGLLASHLPFAESLRAYGVGRWLHEIGHALVAWLGGFPAAPLPFVNVSWEYRSAVVVFLVVGALAAGLTTAVRRRRPYLAALAALGLAVQGCLTLLVSGATCRHWIHLAGCAAELALGALLMVGFHYRPSDRSRWDHARYLALLLGAVALVGGLSLWIHLRDDLALLPVSQALGGLRDPDGDLGRLLADWGWTPSGLVRAYLALGYACLAVVGAHYAAFLGRAIWKARAARSAA